MSSSSRTGLQYFTLVLVFFMGMFIAASMFFAFPDIKGPIGVNIIAAKSTLSSIIAGTPENKNTLDDKDSTEEQVSSQNGFESKPKISYENDKESHKDEVKYRKSELNTESKDFKIDRETPDNPGFSDTAGQHGKLYKLKKVGRENKRQPNIYKTSIASSATTKEIIGDDIRMHTKQGSKAKDKTIAAHEEELNESETESDENTNISRINTATKLDDTNVLNKYEEKDFEIDENIIKDKVLPSNHDEMVLSTNDNNDNKSKSENNKSISYGTEFKQDKNSQNLDRDGVDKVTKMEDGSWKPMKIRKEKSDYNENSSHGSKDKEEKEEKEKNKNEKNSNSIKRDIPFWNEIDDQNLFEIFRTKLNEIEGRKAKLGDTCFNKRTISNSCDKSGCLQMKRPSKPEQRLKQLTHRPGLVLTEPQHAILREMARHVSDTYDVILLTTASSNHFLESQALLQNLHQYVFPVLKNFALLFYDIGLEPSEREEMEKFCRCKVLSFPFEKLPDYVRNLKCYAWKPLMIKAHIRQANVVLWLDASIRFNGDTSRLHTLISRVRNRGVQIGRSGADSSFRTFRSMYHYFGDEPCMYLGMGQAQATIGGYHSEPFVDRVVLEPWVACALNQDCMCPITNRSAGCAESKKMAENLLENNGPIIYGLCHRFDQSAITLILHKLYGAHYRHVMMRVKEYGRIERDNQVEYFKTLKKS